MTAPNDILAGVEKLVEALKGIAQKADEAFGSPLDNTQPCGRLAKEALATAPVLLEQVRLMCQWHPDEILKRLQPEGNRTKADEWEACYALLFKQLQAVLAENRKLHYQLGPSRCPVCSLTDCNDFHELSSPQPPEPKV